MSTYTYHVGDTLPLRVVELANPDGSGWLLDGDAVSLHDRLPDGTVQAVGATVTDLGDATHPSVVAALPPPTSLAGNVRTEVRRTRAGKIETAGAELIYAVEP